MFPIVFHLPELVPIGSCMDYWKVGLLTTMIMEPFCTADHDNDGMIKKFVSHLME